MLVGVAFLPPSFPPSRTLAFYSRNRQNRVNICNTVYLDIVVHRYGVYQQFNTNLDSCGCCSLCDVHQNQNKDHHRCLYALFHKVIHHHNFCYMIPYCSNLTIHNLLNIEARKKTKFLEFMTPCPKR